MTMMVNPPVEIDRGYFEFRVNWDAAALMAMTGDQLERLKKLVNEFGALAQEVDPEPSGSQTLWFSQREAAAPPTGQED